MKKSPVRQIQYGKAKMYLLLRAEANEVDGVPEAGQKAILQVVFGCMENGFKQNLALGVKVKQPVV